MRPARSRAGRSFCTVRADGIGHVGADDREHARGGFGHSGPSSPPSPAMAEVAAARSSGIAPPRKYSGSRRPSTTFASVTVGRATQTVGGRPRTCAGALDRLGSPAGVDPRDRAAACADRVDVDHRREQRIAGDPEVPRRRRRDPAVVDADVGGIPPTSKVISLRRLDWPPAQAPPSTPAAGPESSVRIGRRPSRRSPLRCSSPSRADRPHPRPPSAAGCGRRRRAPSDRRRR